jgi:hypothetical protein
MGWSRVGLTCASRSTVQFTMLAEVEVAGGDLI